MMTMASPNFNKGTDAEIRAEKHLERIYWCVENTKYGEYYDYLVKKGVTDIKIEVKYCEINVETAYLNIRWGQFMNLLKGGEFMIYLMTNRGNGFIKAEDLIKKGHVHHNEISPSLKRFCWFIGIEDENFVFMTASQCRSKLCDGSIKVWLDKHQGAVE